MSWGEGARLGGCFPIDCEARIHQGDGLVDHGIAHSLLRRDALHEPVHSLDVGRPGKQSARSRGWSHETLCRGGIFLEGHEIIRGRTELYAQLTHPIVDGARALDIGVNGFLD